jgi:hypothetical protein
MYMSNKRFAVTIVSIVMAASVIIGALVAFSSGGMLGGSGASSGPAGNDGSSAVDERRVYDTFGHSYRPGDSERTHKPAYRAHP